MIFIERHQKHLLKVIKCLTNFCHLKILRNKISLDRFWKCSKLKYIESTMKGQWIDFVIEITIMKEGYTTTYDKNIFDHKQLFLIYFNWLFAWSSNNSDIYIQIQSFILLINNFGIQIHFHVIINRSGRIINLQKFIID